MPLIEVAVASESFTLGTDNGTASASVTAVASTNTKINNSGVYTGPMAILVTGATEGNCVQNAPMAGAIPATAINVKVDNLPVIRKDDNVTVVVNGNRTITGAPPCTISVKVNVDDAGQTDVKAD